MKLFFLYGFLFIAFNTFAQNKVHLNFQPKFNAENLILNKEYILNSDTLKISNFKFYITNLKYYQKDSLVYTSSQKAYLIDATDSNTFIISEKSFFTFDKVKFKIGIDSLTNVSGVNEGDLDPVNGMYWTWQSGYINFKLEGVSNNCPARKKKFYWHIGGYTDPYNTQRNIALKATENNPLEIFIQLEELFRKVDLSKLYHVMSPSEKAVYIADKLPQIFKVRP